MKSKRVPKESDDRDVVERKRLEQALHASDERFRTLVQLSFDVYWETDAEHRFKRPVAIAPAWPASTIATKLRPFADDSTRRPAYAVAKSS